MSATLRVTVLGAGISGLAAAYEVERTAAGLGRPVDLAVLERRGEAGGKIVTERAQGFVVEGGPDSFLRTKPAAAELCRELGLGDKLVSTHGSDRRVFIQVGANLRAMPAGMFLVVPAQIGDFMRSACLSPAGRLRALADLAIPARRHGPEETIGSLVRRRLGGEAVDRLAQPLLGSLYAGDVDRLSVRATFPQLERLEREHGSLIRGAQAALAATAAGDSGQSTAFLSLEGGLGHLVDALVRRLGARLKTGVTTVGLEERPGDAAPVYRLNFADGGHRDTDVLIMATPAGVSASLLVGIVPHVARGLTAIRHISTATVSLGFQAEDLGRPPEGYGFLTAAGHRTFLRGATWSSNKFADRSGAGTVLVRGFVGGEGRETDVALDDEPMVAAALEALGPILRPRTAPMFSRVFRWPQGQPQYDVGHTEHVAALRAGCPPGVLLTGAAYDGVGLPDCIRSAREAAARIVGGPTPP